MNLSDSIRQRRSVKHYDPSHKLTEDEVRQLLTAAALAPTSYNMQNRHIVCVSDPEVKTQLSAASWGQEQVRDASMVFVLAGSRNAYKNVGRFLRNAPADVQEMLGKMVNASYESNDAFARDEDCRTVGMTCMNLMLAATSMGYDSCPMIGFEPDKVAEIVGLPAEHTPLMMVVVGKGTVPARGRLGVLDFEEFVSSDRFGQPGITGPVEG